MRLMKKLLSSIISITLIASMLYGSFVKNSVKAESNGIAIGDKIELGTYNGKALTWVCGGFDENGALMIAEDVICNKSYDAASNNYSESYRRGAGSNYWDTCCLKTWLNSKGEIDWSTQSAIPSDENVRGSNGYEDEKGFLSSFTDDEMSRVKKVTQKTYINSLDSQLADGGKSKFVYNTNSIDTMLSALGGDYWYKNTTEYFFPIGPEQIKTIKESLPDLLKASSDYWTRQACNTGMSYENISTITKDMTLYYARAYDSTIGVRPAFYIKNENYGGDNDEQWITTGIKVKINDNHEASASFSSDYFVNPKNYPYDLLKYSALASASTYGGSSKTLLQKSGFTRKYEKIFSAKYSSNSNEKCTTESAKSCNHHCNVYTGTQRIKGKNVIAIVISGYSASGYEWISNFELGTGKYHTGFKKAADEVMNMINKKYEDEIADSNVMFWITGHSRGGAVTNLVAAELTKKYGQENVLAYGFATPNVALKSEVNNYANIINVVNDGDFVPYVAPGEWNYSKNGIVMTFDADENMKSLYKSYSGLKYTGTNDVLRAQLMSAFVGVGKDQKTYNNKKLRLTIKLKGPITDIIAGMPTYFSPKDYCQQGLCELANDKKGDPLLGIAKMMVYGSASEDVDVLNTVLFGQEVEEVTSSGVAKILESKELTTKGFKAALKSHHMESYLAFVNSSKGKKRIKNSDFTPYLNATTAAVYKSKTKRLKMVNTVAVVKWSSSNKKIAKVSSNGTITGVKKGTATITAKVNGKSYKCKVTVKNPTLKVNATKATIKKGKTYQIKATPTPSATVIYHSSNKKIASVNGSGLIKGIQKGSATITVKANGVTKKVKITVKN